MMAANPLRKRSNTMSKKTTTKTTKTAKATKKAKAAKPETKPATGECPKGGSHEWADEGDEVFCSKCKEPQSAKAKSSKGTAKAAKATKPAKDKKMSAVDAAAKLLGESGEPMNCKSLIEGIAAKGYWTSPGGKTPHATLYSAIIREISVKGKESRFKKTERGNFAING
jgi:hypothetical protein